MKSFALGIVAVVSALCLPAAAMSQTMSTSMPASPMPMASGPATPKPMHAPVPDFDAPPDFTALKPLIGTWTCKRISSTAKDRNVRNVSRWTYALALGGTWLKISTTAAKQGKMKRPYSGETFIGYDLVAKHWIAMQVGSDSSFDFSTSPGFVNGMLTFKESAATADGFPTWENSTQLQDATHMTFTFVGVTSFTSKKINTEVTACSKI